MALEVMVILQQLKKYFLYNKPMNTYDEYSKIKTYLGLNGVDQDPPAFDGNPIKLVFC